MSTQLRRYFEKDQPINTQNPLLLTDYTLNTILTSLELCGLYYDGYATPFNESLVWLTENFAGPTPPANAIKGQAWFNTEKKLIYVYNGADSRNGGDSTLLTDWIVPVDITAEDLAAHIANVSNPHQVTKAQIGLTNVIDSLQLVASQNLSDLTDKTQARLNLGVYDTAYIDANFAGVGSTVSNSLLINGLSSSQFLRSDIDATTAGKISFTATDGLLFTRLSGIPISIDNGDVKFTVHDNNGNFNIKAGINISGGTDTYRTTGDGTVKVSLDYAGQDAVFSVGVSAIGTIGNSINYGSSTFSVKKDSAYWNNSKIITDAGFVTLGNITPVTDATVDIGSSTTKFNNIYATNFVGTAANASTLSGVAPSIPETASTIVERGVNGEIYATNLYAKDLTVSDSSLLNTSHAVYRDASSGQILYSSKNAMKQWLGISAGGGVGVIAWMSVDATSSIVNNSSGCTFNKIAPGHYRIAFSPAITAIIGNSSSYTVNMGSLDNTPTGATGTSATSLQIRSAWTSTLTNAGFDIYVNQLSNTTPAGSFVNAPYDPTYVSFVVLI